MDLQLKDKVFVVTGGSDGLGFATAEALAGEGAKVVVTGRTLEKFERNRSKLGAAATSVSFFAGDNGDVKFASLLKESVMKQHGRLDGVLVSVGGPPATTALQTTDEQWRQAFESVFLGATRLIVELSAVMSDGGAIALVLSSSAKSAIPTIAISNGLRPGLAMLVKNYADELGARRIRVNALLPGPFATERMKHLAGSASAPANSLKRMGEPSEFGKMAAVMLSPVSSYVTGISFSLDGGMIKAL